MDFMPPAHALHRNRNGERPFELLWAPNGLDSRLRPLVATRQG